jgi:hypothetical protein
MEALFALTPEPDSVEIKQVLSKFENGKAATDILPELIKYARTSPEFLKIINEILQGRQ